jgi:hypothetical protein
MKMAEVPVHASANQESGNSGFESVNNANTQTPSLALTRVGEACAGVYVHEKCAFVQNEPKIM